VEDMSKTVSAIARRSGAREEILEAMANDQLLADIFLLVDGKRTQADIVSELARQGKTTSQPTVSRKLDALIQDHDIVRKKSRNSEGTCYMHTSLAADLKIVRSLTQRASNQLRNGVSSSAKQQKAK
jgi:arginine repressor